MVSTTPDQIEVERKYAADDGVDLLRARVLGLGGTELAVVTFTDTYFDTETCDLTAHDVWLRRRDAIWEIKVPIPGDDKRSGGERSVFREVEGPKGCLVEIEKVLKLEPRDSSSDDEIEDVKSSEKTEDDDLLKLEASMQNLGITSFATFTTNRVKLKLDGASIDIDAASFGHCVVEVEVICGSVAEIAKANSLVERVAEKLRLKDVGATGGKLETYIRKNCADVLKTLVEKGIIKP